MVGDDEGGVPRPDLMAAVLAADKAKKGVEGRAAL